MIRSQMLYPLSYERRCAPQSTAPVAPRAHHSSPGWTDLLRLPAGHAGFRRFAPLRSLRPPSPDCGCILACA